MRTSIKTHTLKLFVAIRSYLCDSCVIWSYIQLFVFWAVLSCAYRSTEEIINQSRVDTRLTREDGHLQHGWWGGSSHTSETNNNYILIVKYPPLLSFNKVRTDQRWGWSTAVMEYALGLGGDDNTQLCFAQTKNHNLFDCCNQLRPIRWQQNVTWQPLTNQKA